MATVSSEGGSVRFLQLPVGTDYTLKLELTGFKTYVQEKIALSFGRDVIMDIRMEPSAIEEQVTVIGISPIIDAKRTQVGVNITSETLMSLPGPQSLGPHDPHAGHAGRPGGRRRERGRAAVLVLRPGQPER
ncbi:MAG: carboxypeptidase-like regulatory domain-containing protein [Ignavibacteriales bacterium]|nr:carboxypeptidase-like regulatory domain-containing protein [Ignavibacteriales bacterium]